MKLVDLEKSRHIGSLRLVDLEKYLPDQLDKDTIYVEDETFAVHFICPCGCGDEIHLPIMEGHWRLNRETVSLEPSILRTVGCKSHFFIRNGEVVWA